ncbi:hypothetical protein PWR66_26090 [Paraburkholderia sp. A1RO-5]|uniref:hypothetical protein n=1 Tax=Paraburkholderia sp. A1RO-5 TaxID=3028369 RepID=UPI003B7F2E76
MKCHVLVKNGPHGVSASARQMEDLRRYPRKAGTKIAYELGFNSASDFNRAFRHADETSPPDFRQFRL